MPKYRTYKGKVIEQIGLTYYVWSDFVHQAWMQRSFQTIEAAKSKISLDCPKWTS